MSSMCVCTRQRGKDNLTNTSLAVEDRANGWIGGDISLLITFLSLKNCSLNWPCYSDHKQKEVRLY